LGNQIAFFISYKGLWEANIINNAQTNGGTYSSFTRGADKSLARPGGNQSTATEDFDVHISYL